MSAGQVFGDSFAVIPDAVLYADVSANAKLLWAILQRHADPDGRCYPGRKRMAELMRTSEDTITRAKKELVDAELLVVEERFDEHGRRTTDNLFLRQARRKDAATVRRKDAATYIKAVELEPEGTRSCASAAKTGPPPAPFDADTLYQDDQGRWYVQ